MAGESPPAQETATDAPEPPAVSEVTFTPSSVILDYPAKEMEIRGTLVKSTGPRPERVWVWAYFINPGEEVGGSRSGEPIELVNPFENGDTATITARGHFHWATTPDVPRTGFLARTSVSSLSPEAARIPTSQRRYDTEDAIEVVSRR